MVLFYFILLVTKASISVRNEFSYQVTEDLTNSDLDHGSLNFFSKNQLVNILGFEGHMVSAATTQLYFNTEAATDSTWMNGCFNKTLFINRGGVARFVCQPMA